MTTLSGIITPSNVETASSASTLTNKTINGSNNTITNVSLSTGVTGTLPVANGGTGAASLTANNVLLGNGTSALQVVAPGSNGNVLTSNGTTWTSAAAGGGFSAAQVFTSSGTFTIPAGKTTIKVTVIGAGGAGGGYDTGNTNTGNGGGGGGGAIKYLTGLTPGNTLTITIGSGGAGVGNDTAGNPGGNSTVASGTQTITTITGGGGGGGRPFSSSGAGGTGTNGDVNITGGTGVNSRSASNTFSPGGSSALGFGGGGGYFDVPTSSAIRTGRLYGGGGSGVAASGQTSGAGANGLVLIEY